MEIKLKVALDEDTLAAINGLTAAIGTALRSAPGTIDAPEAAAPAKKSSAEDKGPFYWRSKAEGTVGEAASLAAYNKLKKADDSIFRITADMYDARIKSLAEETEQEEAKVEKAEKKPKPKAKAKPEKAEATEVPTEKELISAFAAYLPKDLPAGERTERRAFVSAMLQRLGAEKVSQIAEKHRALAVAAVTSKAAGEDIDPEEADWDAFFTASEDEDDMLG